MTEHADPRLAATLAVAERVQQILWTSRIDAVVIGGLALAVHRYPRETEDLDLAVAVSPAELRPLANRFHQEGWDVELREPDASDPLGGVIDIRAPGSDLVQVINFDNSPAGGFPRLVREATAGALPLPSTNLRVVDLHTLIAFKLYAGGGKSSLDILELLDRNRPVDMVVLREKCAALRLDRKLEWVLALGRSG